MKNFVGIKGSVFKLCDGNDIPLIGLGTYALWEQNDVSRAVNFALMFGYRLFDTANYYDNEKELGIAFQHLLPTYKLTRNNIFITSKIHIKAPNVRENAIQMIENSLLQLKTNYIDLMLVHFPKDWTLSNSNAENKTHRLEIYKVLEEYKDAKKIISIGVSNFEINHIEELLLHAKYQPTVNQCEFHPHLTRNSLREYCKNKNIFFQAHTSLAKNTCSLYNNEIVTKLAQSYNITISQLLLAFAYKQNIGIIPKSKRSEKIKENLWTIHVDLKNEDILSLTLLNKNNNEGQYSDCNGWDVV